MLPERFHLPAAEPVLLPVQVDTQLGENVAEIFFYFQGLIADVSALLSSITNWSIGTPSHISSSVVISHIFLPADDNNSEHTSLR